MAKWLSEALWPLQARQWAQSEAALPLAPMQRLLRSSGAMPAPQLEEQKRPGLQVATTTPPARLLLARRLGQWRAPLCLHLALLLPRCNERVSLTVCVCVWS